MRKTKTRLLYRGTTVCAAFQFSRHETARGENVLAFASNALA